MTKHCLLCGSAIQDERIYDENKKRFVRMTRYQEIIDVLVDASRYDRIFYDHDTELPNPYRGIALHMRSALQEKPGKGRELHLKWPDVTALKGEACDIVIEEEREPGQDKIDKDISLITRCGYLWADGSIYRLVKPVLFVLISQANGSTRALVRERVGTFKRVVVCAKQSFEEMYVKHYLQD